jgi:hypothetical protein
MKSCKRSPAAVAQGRTVTVHVGVAEDDALGAGRETGGAVDEA